ncbi:MAG: methyl-accepting chemotaxis protein [Desulfovibrio sp.]|jgi:methyl-accepting chemotaxis protein|nr:methyl-accepting chemotaxis protein [Desulfovibrio sp.]
MTTKMKICTSFIVMILLIGLMSVVGYHGLNSVTKLFSDYSRISHLSVDISDLQASVNTSRFFLEKFLRTGNIKDIEMSASMLTKATDYIKKGESLAKREEQKQRLKNLTDIFRKYIEALHLLKGNQQSFNEISTGQFEPALAKLTALATHLDELALNISNVYVSKQLTALWGRIADLKTAAAEFDAVASVKYADIAEQHTKALMEIVTGLENVLRTDEGQRTGAQITAAVNTLSTVLNQNKTLAVEAEKVLLQMYEWDKTIEYLVDAANERSNADQATISQEISDFSSSTATRMLAISLFGIIFGLLFALFIIVNLIRTLNKVAVYADAVASGDWESRSGIAEKGEIGAMVRAIDQIPHILKNILNDYRNLTARIESGHLNSQCDASGYAGGYATILRGANDIINRLNSVVDALPSPVAVLDKNLTFTYLNAAGRQLAGDDYQGKSCKQVFSRDDDGTATDALRKAVDTLKAASAETRAYPRGQHMDIRYTAIPLLDKNNTLASILQLLVDLTSITNIQRTIQNVAQQAASISGRVAASSEKLSSQVEEVSRGAEMQRTRVENTASAMTEMNSTVIEVAKNVSEASEQSSLTRNKAEEGAELVNHVVMSINSVNTVASTLQDNMQELGKEAKSIGGVMNVISDIADQTNLLALNAAIEAARAGEAGRGFAVVADEVRKLAEKTMSATQEVGNNISAIQHSAQININEVSEAVKAITEATGLANSSGQALMEIVDLATANSSVVTSIATAAEEQSATSEEINRAIEEINALVGQTTDGMIQAASAVQELSHMAQELNRVIGELKAQS